MKAFEIFRKKNQNGSGELTTLNITLPNNEDKTDSDIVEIPTKNVITNKNG